MSRNNVKLLTKEQFKFIDNKYKFTLIDNQIEVSLTSYFRHTLHDIDKPFSIYVKDVRRITFNPITIDIWIKLKDDKKYNKFSLLAIQQAINLLYINYQELNLDNVKKILSKREIKIKQI